MARRQRRPHPGTIIRWAVSRMHACIATRRHPHRPPPPRLLPPVLEQPNNRTCRSGATNVVDTFATIVTGVTNSKPITRSVSVIGVTPFIAKLAMKWINATIVAKWCVAGAAPCCLASFVVAGCAKIAPPPVDGTYIQTYIHTRRPASVEPTSRQVERQWLRLKMNIPHMCVCLWSALRSRLWSARLAFFCVVVVVVSNTDAALCCAVATPNLPLIATRVACRTVWCVWRRDRRIRVSGADTGLRSGWNNSSICDSSPYTRPLSNRAAPIRHIGPATIPWGPVQGRRLTTTLTTPPPPPGLHPLPLNNHRPAVTAPTRIKKIGAT